MTGLRRLPGLGIVVGLNAEAKLARRLCPDALIGISGATRAGADRAVRGLVAQGATRLLSFGLAAGLDPALRPGDLLVPDSVLVDGKRLATDPLLRSLLGPGSAGTLLHSDVLVASRADKADLLARTGCRSLDMESGPVALAAEAAGIPFAVLRAVCDPAERTLPPAACIALQPDGKLQIVNLLRSIMRQPSQVLALLALGRDASWAKTALLKSRTGSLDY
ncbi:MAG: phosphorylase [Janthinobacterium lividum]